MRILFIQDYGINESLALADLSAYLKEKGHACGLLIDHNEPDLGRAVSRFAPELFVIPWDVGARSWVLKTAAWVKKKFPAPIAFCGTYPSFYSDAAIAAEDVEVICLGESEYAISELAQRIQAGRGYTDIKNLWVKNDGRIYKNELRPLIDDLDSLPLPDRSLYFKYAYLRDMTLKRFVSGRGCVNSCSFCYNPLLRSNYAGKGKYLRRKSVRRMIAEINQVRGSAPLKSVHFSDDIFVLDKAWLADFSREYRREVGLPFTCNASAETVDEEIVRLLKSAGCAGVAMGIETGDEEFRNFVLNKRITDSQIRKAAALIKGGGMFLTTFNMIALPGETIEAAFKTMKLNIEIRADHTRLTFAIPLPKTPMADYGLRHGFFDEAQINKLVDKNLYPKDAVLNSGLKWQFENLYCLFFLGVKLPYLNRFIRKLVRLPGLRILGGANSLINAWMESRFFHIGLFSGIKYVLRAGRLVNRTKVFNNYMP